MRGMPLFRRRTPTKLNDEIAEWANGPLINAALIELCLQLKLTRHIELHFLIEGLDLGGPETTQESGSSYSNHVPRLFRADACLANVAINASVLVLACLFQCLRPNPGTPERRICTAIVSQWLMEEWWT